MSDPTGTSFVLDGRLSAGGRRRESLVIDGDGQILANSATTEFFETTKFWRIRLQAGLETIVSTNAGILVRL